MFRLLKALPLALALATLSFFTTSCNSNSQTQIRVVDAIPDLSPALDFDVNTTKINTSALVFTDVQPAPPAYTNVASGGVSLQVYDTGTTTSIFPGGTAVSATFNGSSQYTVVLAGFLNAVGANAPTVLQFTDNNAAPTSGNVEFRIIHASPSAPGSVDIYIVPPGTDINTVSATFSGIAFEQASPTYFSTAAAQYWVIVTTAGSKQEVIFPQDYTLSAGAIRTLVLVDNPSGGNPPSWLLLNDVQ